MSAHLFQFSLRSWLHHHHFHPWAWKIYTMLLKHDNVETYDAML